MGEIFDYVDEMGPTKIIHIHEPSHGLKAVLVVDNVAAGPAIGGLRMAPDVSTRECARLARAMTLKNALAEIPHGGAKSVIFGDPRMPREDKEKLVRELACALGNIDEYIFGPDMGTNEECMAWVNDEIGRSVGLPRELGGIPLDEIGATGWGVSQAVDVALSYCDFDLAGARVVVQGFGAVGRNAARFLAARGALLVGAADSRGTIYHADGLDIDGLTELKRKGSSVIDYNHGHKMKRDEVIDIECEIWIPAARPDVIHEDNVHRLNTRLVVEGANIPITYGAEKILHERGVLSIPDVIANAGGVICAAMEYQHAGQALAMQVVEEKVRANTARILETAKADNILPRDAAVALATERVRRAMALRRWSTF
ncbi:MAG: Glu/Leu/Phe/Val dehydrogenase [Sedimenticola sp.]